MKKVINLHEISARLAARYLARRGSIFVDSAKRRITFPSVQMQHLERRAETARQNGLKRGFLNSDEKEHLRVYRKTVKATNHAMRKLYNKATKQGPGTAASAHDRVRDMLLHADKERLDQALLVGKTPTVRMQVRKFAHHPTTPPPTETGPRFRGPSTSPKKVREAPKRREEMPITYVEPDIPTQHHVVTSAGRVMFSGTREQAHKQALRIGGDRGSLRVIESNHPKIKVGARLSSVDMKELEKQARKRPQNESYEVPVMNELSNRTLIRYIGSALHDMNKANYAYDIARADKRYSGIDRALNKLERRGRIHPTTTTSENHENTQNATVLNELSSGTLLKYVGAAEKSFRRTGLSQRAIGIKRAFRALRAKK